MIVNWLKRKVGARCASRNDHSRNERQSVERKIWISSQVETLRKMKEKTARITTVNVVHLCMYLFVFHQIKLLANSKSSFGMDASMAPPSKCFACLPSAPRLYLSVQTSEPLRNPSRFLKAA